MGLASTFASVLGRAARPLSVLYRLLLLALGVWVGWRSLAAVWPFTIDDAGISYAYAKHLAAGDGPVAAVGGPWVEGYSNALWVFLLVPFQWLGAPLPDVAKVLGVLLFAASVAVGVGLLALNDERRFRSFGALDAGVAIAMAGCLELAVWVVAGLENALFAFLTLLLAWLDARESKAPSRIGASGLAAFALCITRPEGAMYAAPLFAIKLVQALRKREPWRQLVTAAALCFAPLVAYHIAHYFVFGELVPNTYYAKPGSREWSRGYTYLTTHLKDTGLLYALPLVAMGLIGKPRLGLLLGWHCLAGAAFIIYSGGDWMPHGRFLSLFTPALLVLAALGVLNLARVILWLARGRVPRELVLACMSGGLLSLWWGHHAPRFDKVAARPWCHFCEVVAATNTIRKMSRRAGLSSYSLLTHDFGGPAWLSDEQLYPIDFLGLCDPSVARIRHDRSKRDRPRGGMSYDFRFYQYVIHEQPSAPSWLYVPPNFWPRFDLSPEFRGDYFRLSPRRLPRARRDSFFGLHRGELVDYFPPVQRVEFRPLDSWLSLVGSATFVDPAAAVGARAAPVVPGAQLLTLVSVVPRGPVRGTERLKLRVDAGAESVESSSVLMGLGIDGVASQLRDGEPLSFEFSVKLPATPAPSYRLWLGISSPSGAKIEKGEVSAKGWTFAELGDLQPGASAPALERALPRYPAALPAPLHASLRSLRKPVTMAVEQRRRAGHRASPDADLTERLLGLGHDLEARGQAAQAYLAYVWAAQVDRRAWEAVFDTVFRLRQTAIDDRHTTELALLRDYYATGDGAAAARLVAYYLAAARPLEAEYFLHRSSPAPSDEELWVRLTEALGAQLGADELSSTSESRNIFGDVARDPLGTGLDFETPALDGWEGTPQTFGVGGAADKGLSGLRGHHGQGVLASLGGGERARGSLMSPEFTLQGRRLSLLVGGGARKRRVGVELLVEGKAVESAHGNDSSFMFPVMWDVTQHSGKSARLRVFDESTRSYVLLDRVLLWR